MSRIQRPYPWIGGKPPDVDPVRVLIAGTRDFTDFDLLIERMDYYTWWFDVVEVVHGGQKLKIGFNQWAGADYYGGRWAELRWFTQKVFRPDWSQGPKAGPLRNEEMAQYLRPKDVAVFFWNGVSTGTADMISRVKRNGNKYRIVRYKD